MKRGRSRKWIPRGIVPIALAAGLIVFGGASAAVVWAADEENCMLCHRYSGLALSEKSGAERNFYVNEESHSQSAHGRIRCTSCHGDVREIPHRNARRVDCSSECHIIDPSSERVFTHKTIVEQYSTGVHGKRKKGFEADYPDCVWCHSDTIMADSADMPAKLKSSRTQIFRRCRACHSNEPWVDRFFNHFFLRVRPWRSGKNIVERCSECHEDSVMMERHGLESTWTLKDTFHWEAIKYDSPNAPSCITCHAPPWGDFNVHNMKSLNDPESPFAGQEKRMQICAFSGCHPVVTPAFAWGKVHSAGVKVDILKKLDPSKPASAGSLEETTLRLIMGEGERLKSRILASIRLVYKFMIGGIIGFMFLHQVLDYLAILRQKRRGGGHGDHPVRRDVFVVRLTRHEVWQHNTQAAAFIVLAITGFMALIPTATIDAFFGHSSTIFYQARGIIHRTCAVVLVLVTAWHLIYLAASPKGRSVVRDMLPRPKDARDLLAFFRYVFGRGEMPRCDRFDYREKLEYITGGIGMGIITVTGVVLVFSGRFPLFIVDIAALLHLMEAILAVLAISVWHMYAVHVKPGKFPIGTACIDGKLPLHEMEEEHPIYVEAVIKPLLDGASPPGNGLVEIVAGERKLDRRAKSRVVKAGTIVFLAALLSADLAILKLLYFKRIETTRFSTAGTGKAPIKSLEKRRFHSISNIQPREEGVTTLCLACHGGLPHLKMKEVRAMLNMHTSFAACELCHRPKDELAEPDRTGWRVDWYDNSTGAVVKQITPKSGNYNARLAPNILVAGERQRLEKPVSQEYAGSYLKTWAGFGEEQKKSSLAQAHQRLSKNPIQCNGCHRRVAPYLDFAALGYPPNWIEQLTRAEVAGMIDRYSTFHIPTLFNPEEIRRQRETFRNSNGSGRKRP